MQTKQLSHPHFVKAFGILVGTLIASGKYPHQAAVAESLGIDKTRLSRLLSGKIVPGTKTIAQIISRFNRVEAADLLLAYFQDEADSVVRFAKLRGKPSWGDDPLLKVTRFSA